MSQLALPAAAPNQAHLVPQERWHRQVFNEAAHNGIRSLHVAVAKGFEKLSSARLNDNRVKLNAFGDAWYKKVAAAPLVFADHLSLFVEKPLQLFSAGLGSELVLDGILTTKPFWTVNGGLLAKGVAFFENGLAVGIGIAKGALLIVAALTRLGFLATGALASIMVALAEFALTVCGLVGAAVLALGLAIAGGGLAVGLFVLAVVAAWIINLLKILASFVTIGYLCSCDLYITHEDFAAAFAWIKEKITGHKEHNVSGVAQPGPRASEAGPGDSRSRENSGAIMVERPSAAQQAPPSPRNGRNGLSLDTAAPLGDGAPAPVTARRVVVTPRSADIDLGPPACQGGAVPPPAAAASEAPALDQFVNNGGVFDPDHDKAEEA